MCGKVHADDADYLMEGCDSCGNKFFFYVREEHLRKMEEETKDLTKEEVEEIEQDVRDIVPEEANKDEIKEIGVSSDERPKSWLLYIQFFKFF